MVKKRHMIVGISGATGIIYGIRLLEVLKRLDIESHLVISQSAQLTLRYETDLTMKDINALADSYLRKKVNIEMTQNKNTNTLRSREVLKYEKHLPRRPHLFKGIFLLRKIPFPWRKALIAAFAAGSSLIIGILINHTVWGLYGVMGSLTALYIGNEPYAQRGKRLTGVLIGILLSFGLGLWTSGSRPLEIAITFGLVALLSKLVCGSIKLPPPGEYFFIIVFGIATGMPNDIPSIPFHMLLAFIGGGIAWLIAMSGWTIRPHGPEKKAISNAYVALGIFFEELYEKGEAYSQHQTITALRIAEDAVNQGEMAWRKTYLGKQLLFLNEQAYVLFSKGLELASQEDKNINKDLSPALKNVAKIIKSKKGLEDFSLPDELTEMLPNVKKIIRELNNIEADTSSLQRRGTFKKIKENIHFSSFIFQSALRLAVMVFVSTFFAYKIGLQNPYWVPVSCAAILSGINSSAIFYRAVHRSVGTILGLFVTSGIYIWDPNKWEVVLLFVLLFFIIESFVAKNYGIAVIFMTPLTILIAETGNRLLPVQQLLQYRLFDIVLGSLFGFVGSLVWWQKPSLKQLYDLLEQSIISEGKLLNSILQKEDKRRKISHIQSLQTNLINMRALLDVSVGEISKKERKRLEAIWPTMVAVQRLGYQIMAISESNRIYTYPDTEVEAIKLFFQDLSHAVKNSRSQPNPRIDFLRNHPELVMELNTLKETLKSNGIYMDNRLENSS
ncbi:FUSC family protein [Priestia megaterium]|uniref:FUSC family protein n=1 Tax=Priestia megaterium TaxID=1404 RepID=UPI0025B06638|nr:FUSC family protein [Priestia megaterium]MDN3233177.1 FUSC family protein [Priestia megaterium]